MSRAKPGTKTRVQSDERKGQDKRKQGLPKEEEVASQGEGHFKPKREHQQHSQQQ